MARPAVANLIAELDAISRTRALTAGESSQLAKLITTERRYKYMAAANARVRK